MKIHTKNEVTKMTELTLLYTTKYELKAYLKDKSLTTEERCQSKKELRMIKSEIFKLNQTSK